MVTATDIELKFHSSVMAKDDLALAKLYDLYSEHIIKCLKNWYPKHANQDEALILEAVNEAFFGYYKNPQTFNPQINTLVRFLEIAADRDIINILNREKKVAQKQNLPEDVELEEKFWNSVKKDVNTTDGQLIHDQSLAIIDKELAIHFNTEMDVKLAKLVLAGERETAPYSEVLNINELSIEKQRKEVKKHKDRIKIALKRNKIESKLKNQLHE